MSFRFCKIRLFCFIFIKFYFLSSFSIEVDKGKYQAHWEENDSFFRKYLSVLISKLILLEYCCTTWLTFGVVNSVVSNANFSSIEPVRTPVFEHFRARSSPNIRFSNILEQFHYIADKCLARI